MNLDVCPCCFRHLTDSQVNFEPRPDAPSSYTTSTMASLVRKVRPVTTAPSTRHPSKHTGLGGGGYMMASTSWPRNCTINPNTPLLTDFPSNNTLFHKFLLAYPFHHLVQHTFLLGNIPEANSWNVSIYTILWRPSRAALRWPPYPASSLYNRPDPSLLLELNHSSLLP